MPVTISGNSLNGIIEGIQSRVSSPDLVAELGQAMSDSLVQAFEASNSSQSGATVRALSKVGAPERTSTGWKISVGDGEAVGSESQIAPRGTLSKFYEYMKPTGLVNKFTRWQGMPRNLKDLLEQGRRAGMWGGRGPNYANYMWVQNKGNPRAGIAGHGFIERGIEQWHNVAPDILERWLSAN